MHQVPLFILDGTRNAKARLRLLRAVHGRPRTGAELAVELELDAETVDSQLRVLRENGFVTRRDADRRGVYSVTERAEAHWDAIEALLERTDDQRPRDAATAR